MLGYLALGSNLSRRREHLQRGLADLRGSGVEIRAVSSVWESEPVGTLVASATLGYLLLSQTLTGWQMVGMALVVGAVVGDSPAATSASSAISSRTVCRSFRSWCAIRIVTFITTSW